MDEQVTPAVTTKELEDMVTAKDALWAKVRLPPKAQFRLGKAIHIQFDGGSQEGHSSGGFVILNGDGQELVRAGHYYGTGQTNNEAKSFALWDSLQCRVHLSSRRGDLGLPVWVFGDN